MTRHDDSGKPVFRGLVRLDRLPDTGRSAVLEPDEAERRAAATLLGLEDLPRLRFSYTLTLLGPRKWRLQGLLEATVVQSCVVTLDSVSGDISEQITSEFWPAEELARHEFRPGEDDLEVALDGPEPVENGILPLGQFVYEALASAIDPYPRAPGAELPEGYGDTASPGPGSSPFAALQKLTGRSN
ncbi:MAG: DUF177 domain-containing protein [Hyphomicrobiales bacterium]